MSRPRSRAHQVVIDELPLDYEHIPGSMPADEAAAQAVKTRYYQELFDRQSQAGAPVCRPALRIHLFNPMSRFCQCAEEQRSLAAAVAQQKEHK